VQVQHRHTCAARRHCWASCTHAYWTRWVVPVKYCSLTLPLLAGDPFASPVSAHFVLGPQSSTRLVFWGSEASRQSISAFAPIQPVGKVKEQRKQLANQSHQLNKPVVLCGTTPCRLRTCASVCCRHGQSWWRRAVCLSTTGTSCWHKVGAPQCSTAHLSTPHTTQRRSTQLNPGP
jgi:hypothetical protein